MNLNSWLLRLEQLHPSAIELGLERVKLVAERMGLLTGNPFIFVVAGTNGKGSTTAMLQQVLLANGCRVGVYTSPHLIRFNERIAVNQDYATDEQIIAAFEAVDQARGEDRLTYFEFTTLTAIYLFKQAQLDCWVLEVGMGGRLDAVNAWDADVAIVTSIDLDHCQWLGSDRASIGCEKVAIGRPGKPLVIGEPDIPIETLNAAQKTGAKVLRIGHDFNLEKAASSDHWTFTGADKRTIDNITHTGFHPNNLASVTQALISSNLNVDFTQFATILERTKLVGRQTRLATRPETLIDVGHNPHAARWLAQQLERKAEANQQVHCLIAMLEDKDIDATVTELMHVVDCWYPKTLSVERGCCGAKIAQVLSHSGARVKGNADESPSEGFRRLLSSIPERDLIVVFGSFYTVSDVLAEEEGKDHWIKA